MAGAHMDQAIRHLVVVGGGSAGWLVAGVLAAAHGRAAGGALRVTLLESPDVAPIGVGEGTWPTMRDTLRRIGVSESAFVRDCDVAFKQGSLFRGWVDGSADDYYFHPFMLPEGFGDADLVAGWLRGHAGGPFADLACVQPHLCAQGRGPKQAATPEFAAVANYAYHLDAGKFATFLMRHCVDVLGVEHVRDHLTGVDAHADGDIAALQLRERGALAGELFVDCTGMASLLLGGHYGVPFRPQRDVLFCDRALAVQVPYPADDTPIASQTISTAQASGWIWDIGLPTRRGVGHVYSSAHSSDADAEAVLRAYLRATQGSDADGRAFDGAAIAPRQLRFEPGYRERFWSHNCVAIGLSAGFIEPLEASALALVELSAAMLADQFPADRGVMRLLSRRFNAAFEYRWERIIEFLKLHYVLSRRDTPFWRDHRGEGSIPPRLREQLALWSTLPPSRYDLHRVDEVFPAASYQYVLYGMGFRPDAAPTAGGEALAAADARFRDAAALTQRMLRALPAHRPLLEQIRQHGLPLS
jgi:tryptophan halogenase